jgi:uncharacterized membrane-anchored protein YhcB (DUF1043 family)
VTKHAETWLWGIAIGLIIGFIIGGSVVFELCNDAAVKAGKAEYYLDENNEKKWRWK